MIVLGIDPGLASTGYAVVTRENSIYRVLRHGVIRTIPTTPHPARLLEIHDQIRDVLASFAVDGAAIESWFIHPVSKAAMGMAETRGAIQIAIAAAGIPIAEFSPNTIKQAVTGSGRANKDQVRSMIERITGAAPETDHAADAIAAAICHISSAGLSRAIRQAR